MTEKNVIELAKRSGSEGKDQTLSCSFCGRKYDDVLKMVKGPGVNICSECVMIAVQYLILKDSMPSADAQKILDAFWGSAHKGEKEQ